MTANRKTTQANAAASVTEQVEAAVNAGKETVEAAVKVTADAAAQGYEKAVTMTRENVEAAVKAGTEVFKSYEDLVSFGKENVDAAVRSGSLWVKGVQDINKTMLGLAQSSVEDSLAATQAMFGCKNLQDLVKLQSDLARKQYDRMVNEGRRVADMSVKVAETSFEPINARVAVTVEKLTQPLAA